MPEVKLKPTVYLEPLLRFNRTGNSCLTRWRDGYAKENEWVVVLLVELTNTTNRRNLIPRILSVLDQVNQEPKFIVPQMPYNSEEISFTTQEHMFPLRIIGQERTLSITYSVLWEFISGL